MISFVRTLAVVSLIGAAAVGLSACSTAGADQTQARIAAAEAAAQRAEQAAAAAQQSAARAEAAAERTERVFQQSQRK